MNKINIKTVICCLLFALGMTMHCSQNLAGGTEDVNTKVVGKILNTDNTAANNVQVMLIPCNFNPKTDILDERIVIDTTDSCGVFNITAPEAGQYNIQAVDFSKGTKLLISNVTVKNNSGSDSTDVPPAKLNSTGVINVSLPAGADSNSGYIFIPGTTIYRLIHIHSYESIVIDSTPAGIIPVICLSNADTSRPQILRFNVNVIPDDTVAVTNPGWLYSTSILINTSASGAQIYGNVVAFPLLIKLTKNNFDFTQAHPAGNDIRFTKKDNSSLPFEIERWDADLGVAEIWVRLDTVYGNNCTQTIKMFWGNGSAYCESNGTTVFDTTDGFRGVWHLNENPSAGKNSIKDRTVNGYNATPSGMTGENIVSGMVGNAFNYDGTDDYIDAGAVNLTGNYSLSCWVNLKDISAHRRIIWKQFAYTIWYDKGYAGFRVEHYSDTLWRGIAEDGGVAQPVTVDTWYYLTGTYDGDKVKLYINGELKTETQSIGLNPQWSAEDVFIGRKAEFMSGMLDEVRIESVSRSADWIKLCYINQYGPGTMILFEP